MLTPLHEVVESLSDEQIGRWERLYMVADRRGNLVHPLVYPHPNTGKEVYTHMRIACSTFVEITML